MGQAPKRCRSQKAAPLKTAIEPPLKFATYSVPLFVITMPRGFLPAGSVRSTFAVGMSICVTESPDQVAAKIDLLSGESTRILGCAPVGISLATRFVFTSMNCTLLRMKFDAKIVVP